MNGAIKVLLADGNYHRRWGFNSCGEWIEGVGSTSNLLAPAYPCSLSGGWRLNCFVDSSGLVYSYDGICITDIKELQSDMRLLKIFPNPSNDMLNVEALVSIKKNSCYKIYDELGKIIQEEKNIPSYINIKGLSKGVYFICFENDGKKEIRKFVKY